VTTDWIPFELVSSGKHRLVRWIDPCGQAFLEPFFNQTIRALIDGKSAQKLTPGEELAAVQPARVPKGFIFHVSRCGSTLVSRSLAAVLGHRVISESAALNQLLMDPGLEQGYRLQLLKGLIHAWCGTAADTACFVKFTSWNLLFLEQILALFPTTPWIFVYREPGEVLRSLTRSPPNWATNQKLATLMGHPDLTGLAPMIFTLERMFKAALPQLTQLARPVNYCQLPDAIVDIAAHFGLELDPVDRGRMVGMGQYGTVKFLARGPEPFPPELGNEVLPLNLLYQEWERVRSSQQTSIDG
jgi:hypothetical protein